MDSDPKWLQETIWDAISGIGPCLLQLSTDAEDLNTPPNNIGLLSLKSIEFFMGVPLSVVSAVSSLYSSSLPLKSFDWVQRCRIQAKHSLFYENVI